jgi:hypothetical protein
MKGQKQTIGFLDQGKGTTLIDCSSEGFDIGLKSEGEDLLAKNFKSINNSDKSAWYERWYMKYLAFPLLVLLGGLIITFYFELY